MAIIGYARVSTSGQSLEAQLKALKEAGIENDHLFQEKASAVKRDRPELEAMLKHARKGDTVIVTKVDRIARSTKHLLEIVETLVSKSVTLKILNINLDTSTPTGKLMLTMLGGIAEFEREIMLERQREGYEIAKAKGKIKGRPSTAQDKAADVLRMASEGATRQHIANTLGIGIASVYRLLKESKQ
jgi:DNA invertase Pin-like site-specific DNA recombinase